MRESHKHDCPFWHYRKREGYHDDAGPDDYLPRGSDDLGSQPVDELADEADNFHYSIRVQISVNNECCNARLNFQEWRGIR